MLAEDEAWGRNIFASDLLITLLVTKIKRTERVILFGFFVIVIAQELCLLHPQPLVPVQ